MSRSPNFGNRTDHMSFATSGRVIRTRHSVDIYFILALGRSIYKRVPKEYVQPLEEGRMLIVNVSDAVRQGWWTSQHRNFVVANWADECVWAGVHQGSTLDVPHSIYVTKSKLIEDFLFASNTF